MPKSARVARMGEDTESTSALPDDATVKDALDDRGLEVSSGDEVRASTQDTAVSEDYGFEDNELITVVPKVKKG